MKLTAFGAVVGDVESGSFGLSVHKTLEEALKAYEQEVGGEEAEGTEEEAPGGQSCMFASVYETPFEDIDAAEAGKWEPASSGVSGEEYWPILCKIAFQKGEGGAEDSLAITRPAIIELQCFELLFKAMAELISKGELKSKGDTVRDAAGPWTVKAASKAGSQAGEEVEVEVEISLPMLESKSVYL